MSTPPRKTGLRALPACALLLTALSAHAQPQAAATFDVGPPEPWVAPLPVPAPPAVAPPDAWGGVHALLLDQQTRVGPVGQARYVHEARHFLSSAGVEDGAQVSVTFAPSYERLTLHGAWLVRGERRIPVLERDEVKLVQQERGLEERLYDGRVSALLFVKDARAGDTLELAYTVTGANPVLAGRFFDRFIAGFPMPVAHWRERLLWPAARHLAVRSHGGAPEPVVRALGDEREYTWERRELGAAQVEDGRPGWLQPYAWVQLAEAASWAEVDAWAQGLFADPGAPSPALTAEVERLRALGSPERQLAEALRFVQDEVRYLGIEMGAHSHRPHTPSLVVERRFGDCKDKAFLLVTLLRAVGIDAHPALVHTREGHVLDAQLPWPYAFNHAIARVRLGGRTYWLDGTRTQQRGPVEQMEPAAWERALVVGDGAGGLASVPLPRVETPDLEVDEEYRLGAEDGATALDVVTVFRGRRASLMRYRLATTPRPEVERHLLNFYAGELPGLRARAPLEVHDDAATNTVRTVERYLTPGFGAQGFQDLGSHVVAEYLQLPRLTQRTSPLGVAHPVHVRHRIRVEPRAGALGGGEPDTVVEGPASRLTLRRAESGASLSLDLTYRSLADAVVPAELARHLDAVRRGRELLGVRYTAPGAGLRAADGAAGTGWRGLLRWWPAAFTLLLAALLFGVRPSSLLRPVRRLVQRVRALRVRRPGPAGRTPRTALYLPAGADLRLHLARATCTCGARKGGVPLGHEPVLLDGRRLTTVRWRCLSCGAETRTFFEVSDRDVA